MPLPLVPAPTPGAVVVAFDTASAEAALIALDEVKTSLAAVDTTVTREAGEAGRGWTGAAAEWFATQQGTSGTDAAQTAVDTTMAAIRLVAQAAVDQQIANNAHAEAARQAELRRLEQLAEAGGGAHP